MIKNTILLLFAVTLQYSSRAQTTIIPYSSSWKYFDKGTNLKTSWRNTSYNDASWASGNAELGYGDGDETTVVSYGSNPNKKYVTTYFRKAVTVANASLFTNYTLSIRRDDGAVVYINGTERYRTNMPTGTISYTTKASTDAADDGNTPQVIIIPAGSLINGNNVIAVEIHQRTVTSSDISFDLELSGNGDTTPPTVTGFTPADNAINVAANSNLTINFNEAVQKGTGNILIRESGIITQTIDVTSATVVISGNTVTINPADFGNAAAVNIEIAAGAFKDLSNNNYAGIANATAWNFTVVNTDIIPPVVTVYSPADNSTDIAAASNLTLTFNEPVQKGSGNIIVKESGIITQTINVSAASVTVSGNTVTIDPADFGNGAAVNIEIAAGAFKDIANNNYAGIADATTWNFDVLYVDITPPTVTDLTPADNAANISTAAGLEITFSEYVQKGTGNILIKESGIITQTIDVASSLVSVSGNTVSIDPADFGNGAAVNIEIAPGAFKDLAGNNYAGIANSTTWNFGVLYTDITPPAVTVYAPADNSIGVSTVANLVLTFTENIQKGTGNILIKEGAVITQTIDVTSASVVVSGNTVTIDPADFGNAAAVNIEIAAGAFKDLADNNYAGIADASAWNFITESIPSGPQTLIPYGASWKYLDNGTDQGTAWTGNSFNDASWASGNAQLGYGDGDETTVVSYGADANNKYITTYFRKTINITNPAAFSVVDGSVKRDDGIVIYVNGTEVYRNNMSSGNIVYNTLAPAAAADDGNTAQLFTISPTSFVNGTNTVAVEIHQSALNSTDISFDLELIGTVDLTAPAVTTYSPSDNATAVASTANLVLGFNEPVQKGTGNIIIKEGGVVTQTIDVSSVSVTVSGNIVTIDPADFTNSAAVNIEIAPTAFKDLANNFYAGISNAATWNFTVAIPDITAPVVTVYSPLDNATSVSVSSNLVMTFDENIQKGSGNILVKEAGAITQTINVSSAAVVVSGNTVTINPADFGFNKAVNIEIEAGAFSDLSNNNYAGITNAGTWNFTTEDLITGPQTFINYGDSWKYLDNGTNQNTVWRGTSFNDASWANGNAQLGYGDGDETTVVSYGPNANAKYITTYFRKTITISNPLSFTSFTGSVKRDDGVVIYLNGTELYRNNMPTGTISYTTVASTAASDDGNTPQLFTISSSAFVSGTNVIAVEMHQNSGTSTDLSFDMQLTGNVAGAAVLTRGPYMNSAIQTGVIIRWRTDVATNSKVNFGTSAGSLNQNIIDNTVTTEHEVTLTGLTANTLYYYNFGSTAQILQGDANNYFKTMPLAGSSQKTRFIAMGDVGNNSTNQINVRNAWQAFNGTNYTDGWLLMGDNAYNNGTDAEFQNNFFNVYQGNLTKNHVLWPSPGNHDYANSAARQADHAIPYYDMFSLPKFGQAGGLASNTEAYYSYNYGNIHFVALDSYGWEAGNTRLYDTLGPQAVWLKQDLAVNNQLWTVVYFHHPPYTKGSHNSDTESELINMRQKIIPILERYKVDLVLSGHSHLYERSFLINGHYGLENTYNASAHALSTSSAKYDGSSNSCIYIKQASDVLNGIVYAVVGSSGQVGGSTAGYPHNAMYYSNNTNGGAMYLEIENNRLISKWVCSDGVVRDNFSIMKNVNKTTTIMINSGVSIPISASWIGNYSWSTGATTQTINVAPLVNTTYTVVDGNGCLIDVINVEVMQPLTFADNAIKNGAFSFSLYPAEVKSGEPVTVQSKNTKLNEYVLIDINGRILKRYKSSGKTSVETNILIPGTYFLKLIGEKKTEVRKFIVLK